MKRALKIVAVDDDPVSLSLVEALLTKEGHQVVVLDSSVQALETILRIRPDCVLLDIMMPDLDGLELCKTLREAPTLGDLRIVVFSAKGYDFDRRRALELGADAFLLKPGDTEVFATKLRQVLSDRIQVKFWGVRGTLAVPGHKSLRYGGNTSCVTVDLPGHNLFVFDAGTGIKELSNSLMADGRRRIEGKVFISHPHWDHINAIPFFAPLYVQGNEFEILGASHGDISMRDMISAQMDGVYFPITMREFASHVYFRDLKEGSYEVDGVAVKTMLLSHPGYCLGYRLDHAGRSICYVTDNELHLPTSERYSAHCEKRLTDFVRKADVLITDTTYTDDEYKGKEDWGHSAVSQVADLAHRAEVKTLYLFHHDPDQDDDAIDRKHQACARSLQDRGSSTVCVAPRELDELTI